MKTFTYYFTLFFGLPLVWCYLRLIQLTSNIIIEGESRVDELHANGDGHVFVFWHNRQLFLPLLRPRTIIHCLISDSRDGDYMSAVIRLFNKRAVRGSSSRNGLAAMKEIMRLLKRGEAIGVATDGPRGPAFKVKPGVIQMARASGTPIIPISFDTSRKKVLGGWDQTYLLYPFARTVVVYGKPFYIGDEFSNDSGVEDACEQLRLAIESAAERASELLNDKEVSH